MPEDLREARKAEVNADLWEHQRDAATDGRSAGSVAAEILIRTLCGIPDDLGWRREAMSPSRSKDFRGRTEMMTISSTQLRRLGMSAVLIGILWIVVWTLDVFFDLAPVDTRGEIYLATGFLFLMLGAAGLYVQLRARISKPGSLGMAVLVAGSLTFLVASLGALWAVSDKEGLLAASLRSGSVLGAIWVVLFLGGRFLVPIGFILFGLGLPSPGRRAPLILGCWLLLEPLLKGFGLAYAMAWTVVPGLCLGFIGYSIWSGTRSTPASTVDL